MRLMPPDAEVGEYQGKYYHIKCLRCKAPGCRKHKQGLPASEFLIKEDPLVQDIQTIRVACFVSWVFVNWMLNAGGVLSRAF